MITSHTVLKFYSKAIRRSNERSVTFRPYFAVSLAILKFDHFNLSNVTFM